MADTATTAAGGGRLEERLDAMLGIETFEPSEEFRRSALLGDPSVYEEAERDWRGWWLTQAKSLHWFTEPIESVDESDPPFYRWFADGTLNASYNCLDRHVEAGHGDRVAFHWRGEEGEELDITYAEFHRDVQQFANALKDLGIRKGDIVGIYLPMIPEVVVAMLACARIGAPHNVVFGGFSAESVRERLEFAEAKALITLDGARRKGRTSPIKQQVDEAMADLETLEHVIVVKYVGAECEMQEGRDLWFHDVMGRASDECPAEPLEAEHPLYVLYTSGSTAKPKGVVHTTGGYLTGVTSTHRYMGPPARAGRLLVLGRRRLGDRPLLHRLWADGQRGHERDVRGGSRLPAQGDLVGAVRALWDDDLLHRADGDPGLHEMGHVEKYDLSKLRALGTVGEPINPKTWLWYHTVVGGERCPIVETRCTLGSTD